MCSRSVTLILLVTISATGTAQRRSRSRLAFHDIKDVFFRYPERYSIQEYQPRTLKHKTNYTHKLISEKNKSPSGITRCQGLDCISKVSSSNTNAFLDKALNMLDNHPTLNNDLKNNDRAESSLAKLLATTSDVEDSNLEINDKRTNNTTKKLVKKSRGKTITGSKRQNWLKFTNPHNYFGPHLPTHFAPPPIHVMDPFYSHGNSRIHPIHSMHQFYPLMHPGGFHGHLMNQIEPPLAIHHHHPLADFKTHGGLFGSVPPYPIVPGAIPGPNLPGPPNVPFVEPPPMSLAEPLPGQFIHNAGPPIEGHHVVEPPAILPDMVHSGTNGMRFPLPPPQLHPPPIQLSNGMNFQSPPRLHPTQLEFGKTPYPLSYPLSSSPRIKEVPVPIRVPVRGPSIIHKYFYPVRMPSPGPIHHVPYPVYIQQPSSIKPYFAPFSSPPQRIPAPVPSRPKVIVQRVPYPVMIQRPVQVIHNNQIYSDTGHCRTNPCINGGTCTAFTDYYRCHCPVGFKGFHCEEQSKCHPNPCRNLGVCTEVEKDYECTCQPGYKGMNCEAPDPCVPSPCKNGGLCAQVGNGYSCQCKAGWLGKDCGMESKCLPINPCQNSGVCTEALDSYHCNCPLSWRGLNCEIAGTAMQPSMGLPPVISQIAKTGGCGSCHPNAFCHEDHCVCYPGYIGDGYDCDVMQHQIMFGMKTSYMTSEKRQQVHQNVPKATNGQRQRVAVN